MKPIFSEESVVFTNGCFDILHRGHIEMLRYCRMRGDIVIVGIDADARVKRNKGPHRPINSAEDRKIMLESLRFVDRVEIFENEEDLTALVDRYSPDLMIVGEDYRNKKVIGSEYALELEFFPKVGEYSTTQVLRGWQS